MGYTSTTTAKVTADTSGVQAAIKDLKKELKDIGKSVNTDDVRDKLKAISDSAAPAGAKLAELKKIAKEIEFNGFDDADLIKEVAEAIADTTMQSNLMKDAIRDAQNELQGVSKQKSGFTDVRESIKKTTDEINNLKNRETELKKIQEEYIKQKVDKQSPEWQSLQAEIKKTENALKKAKGEQTSFVNVDFGPLKGQLDSLANSFGVLGGKAGGVTSMLGKAGPMIANPYVAAGAAVVGLGAAWFEYNKKLDESLQRTEQFTGLSGNALLSLRNGIEACASTWGKDYNTVLSGVDTLMSHYGMSGEKALEIISKGFTSGADDAGKMLDMMSKYSGAFKDMGISADELTALISQTKSGIFSEEGMDLIQKAGEKLREFNSKTEESLKAIGIDTEQMFAKMQSGELRTVDAVKMVSARLKDVGVQSQEAGEVLRNVFGKQGAKAGMELVTALSEVETSLDACVESTDEMHKANKALEDAQRDLENAMASMFGVANGGFATMVTKIKTEVIRYVVELMNRIIDLYNESIAFRGAVQGIIFAFKALGDVCKSVMNLMMDQWKALGTLIEGVIRGDFKMMGQGITDFYDAFKKASKTAVDGIIKDFGDMVDNIEKSRIEKVTIPIEEEVTRTTNEVFNPANNKGGSDNKKDGKTGKKTEKIDYLVSVDDKTLDTAKKKLQAWENRLNELPVTATAEIEEAKREIEKWRFETERRKFLISGEINKDYFKAVQKKIDELKEAKTKINPELDPERYSEVENELKEFTERKYEMFMVLNFNNKELSDIQKRINDLKGKLVNIDPQLDGEKYSEIENELNSLVDRKYQLMVGLNFNNREINDIQKRIDELKGKLVNIDPELDQQRYSEIQNELNSLVDRKYHIMVGLNFNNKEIIDIQKRIDELKGKIVEIDPIFDKEKYSEIENEINRLTEHRNEIMLGLNFNNKELTDIQKRIYDLKGAIVEIDPILDKEKYSEIENELNSLSERRNQIMEISLNYNNKEFVEIQRQIDELKIAEIKVNPELDPERYAEIRQQLDELTEKQREVVINSELNLDPSPLKNIQNKLNELREIQSRLNPELDEEKIKEVVAKIKEYSELEFETKVKLGIEVPMGPLQQLQREIKRIEEERLTLNPEIDQAKLAELNKKLDDLVSKERKMKVDLGQEQKDSYKTTVQVDTKEVGKAIPQLQQMSGLLKGMGISKIDVVFNADGTVDIEQTLDNIKQQVENVIQGVNTLGSMFSSLGQAIGGAGGQLMNFMSTAIQGISQLIPLITQLIAKQTAEAFASGIASASKTQPAWLIPVQIAAVVASIAAAFATMPKFAEGGIVGGASYNGDKIIARLNSGEGVLTQEGVSNLHQLAGSANTVLEGAVEFKIDGKVIKGVLSNYEKVGKRLKK